MLDLTKIDPSEMELVELSTRVALARKYAKNREILNWGKTVFPNDFTASFSPMHKYIEANHSLKKLSLKAPRGNGKTAIACFLIPIFYALNFVFNFFDHLLLIEGTQSKASALIENIKNKIETSEIIYHLYGDQIGRRKWTQDQIVLANGKIITARTASSPMATRGITYDNRRPDWIIGDDIFDDSHFQNPSKTLERVTWFNQTLLPCGNEDPRVHVFGTAVNAYDLQTRLESLTHYTSKTFKAVLDFEKKIVLWDHYSFDNLMQKREEMGSLIFAREYQNEITSDTTSIVKMHWLYAEGYSWERSIDELLKLLDDGDLEIVDFIVGNDPSIGSNDDSDFNGLAGVLVTKKPDQEDDEKLYNYWIIDLDSDRLTQDGRVRRITDFVQRLEQTIKEEIFDVRIEAISGFRDYAGRVESETSLPVSMITSVKSKAVNLTNKSAIFERKKIFLISEISEKLKSTLVEQLTITESKHDDVRDSVLLCLPAWDKLKRQKESEEPAVYLV